MTHSHITALLVALCLVTLSIPNHAQIITHWYFGAGLLNSDQEVADQSSSEIFTNGTLVENNTTDGSDNGWKLFGGYQFHKNFAVEAAFIDLGKFNRIGSRDLLNAPLASETDEVIIDIESDRNTELHPKGISLTGIALVTPVQGLSIQARSGIIFTDYDTKNRDQIRFPEFTLDGETTPAATVNRSFSENVTGVEFIAGVGINYRLLPDWSIGFQWERYFDIGDDDIRIEEDIDIVAFNVIFHY